MKDLKSDWHNKLKEDNIEALLHIKVKGSNFEEFIKEHSSDAAVFWWDAKEQKRREWEWKNNKKNVLERLNSLVLQKNSSIPFLKAALMKIKAILFSTLVTMKQS